MDTKTEMKPDPKATEAAPCCGGKTKATVQQPQQDQQKQEKKEKSDTSCCGGHD